MEIEICDLIARAVREGNVEEVRRLFAENPGLLLQSFEGGCWLDLAVFEGHLHMVRFLIDAGCDVNSEDDSGDRLTPLDRAVWSNNPEIVRLLLEHGANPNQGMQLIGAIAGQRENSLEMVKLLDRHGADLHRFFTNDHTGEPMNALSTALDWGRNDVAEYLRSRGAVLPKVAPQKSGQKTLADEVVDYVSKSFGPVQRRALVEIVPSEPAIVVHVVAPGDGRNHITLFTTGMCARGMRVPRGQEDYQFAELFIELPADWKYWQINNPDDGWPVHWLRSTAKYPHKNSTWLGGPATIIANGDPPERLSPNCPYTSMLLLAEKHFTASDGRFIRLYRMMPLYTEERNLEMREGIGALLRAMDDNDIPFVVQRSRRNVGRRK
jgi:hypothetical protein